MDFQLHYRLSISQVLNARAGPQEKSPAPPSWVRRGWVVGPPQIAQPTWPHMNPTWGRVGTHVCPTWDAKLAIILACTSPPHGANVGCQCCLANVYPMLSQHELPMFKSWHPRCIPCFAHMCILALPWLPMCFPCDIGFNMAAKVFPMSSQCKSRMYPMVCPYVYIGFTLAANVFPMLYLITG